jgi:hypothetical protein
MCCRSMRRTISCIAAVALILGTTACIHGQTEIPIDDFDDMDPNLAGWTKFDLSAGQPWGDGIYDPSSGALRIYHTGGVPVPPGTPFETTAMFLSWDASTDPLYSNGFLQAKVRNDTPDSNAALEMRGTLATGTAYVLFLSTSPPSANPEFAGGIALDKFVGGVSTPVWRSDFEYQMGEEWNLELGTIGDRITARAWKVGDPEPLLPQYDEIDLEPIMSGMVLISADKILGVQNPALGDATFDDIVFVAIPEPSTFALVAFGMLGIVGYRRMRL